MSEVKGFISTVSLTCEVAKDHTLNIMMEIADELDISIEGFPVFCNFDSFWKLSAYSDMDGEYDQLEEIDDDLLGMLPLDDLQSPCISDEAHEPVVDEDPLISKSSQQGAIIGTQKDKLYEHDLPVQIPESFPFPFEPYDIQKRFMEQLYKALELGKIGIFESPTGTGKSLSIICAALRWLKDHAERQQNELEELMHVEKHKKEGVKEALKSDPDWIQDFAVKQELDEKAKQLKEEHEARKKQEEKIKAIRLHKYNKKRKRDTLDETFRELFKDAPSDLKEQLAAELKQVDSEDKIEDDDIVLEEYFSDEESVMKGDEGDEEDLSEVHITKIYYCSRTHSQLSQFVREIKKSPYSADTAVISLGSRQNMCVNDEVRKLNSLSLINDRCLEMQKNKEKKQKDDESKRQKLSKGCPYYKQDPVLRFKDAALVEICDIEDLVKRGKVMKACPYYATRYAIPSAELVALPYNTLLHKATRESSGIKLKGNIVIIDEAHNLIETIGSIYSVEITGSQLTCAYSQLSQYQDRYRSRLKAKNLMYIKQLLFLLSTFIKHLGGKIGIPAEQQKLAETGTRLQTINDFLFDCHVDNLNLFKVLHYCEKSMIARKLHGYVEKYKHQLKIPAEERKEDKTSTWALSRFLKELSQPKAGMLIDSDESQDVDKTEKEHCTTTVTSPLIQILGLLEALTNANKDGRMVITRKQFLSNSSLKFLLLNPAVYFESILSEARAVIVAGGTMEPVSSFKEQLFYAAGVPPERILQYSCGHVIKEDQLLPMAVRRGPSGLELDFTYHHRDNVDMMDELGRIVYNICNVVTGGIVVFLPSYEYEKTVYSHWQKTGCLTRICAKKKLFREPKKSNQVDVLLSEYTSFIKKHCSNKYSSYTGAIILCVVGGKMSEGINFSDDLGRCILMVGLPYPNIKSPELKEKMDYLNATMPKSVDGRTPGQVHYENLCMKAVNQSIGRAIRHKDDYATIMLLDHRYLRSSVKTKLPCWIADKMINVDRFGPVFVHLRKFFSSKRPIIAT